MTLKVTHIILYDFFWLINLGTESSNLIGFFPFKLIVFFLKKKKSANLIYRQRMHELLLVLTLIMDYVIIIFIIKIMLF